MNGNKLRTLRESNGLLQKQLGNTLGISPSTIGMYEQNRREPDNNTLKKIANFFKVSTDYLLDNEYQKYEKEKIQIEKDALKEMLVKSGYMSTTDDLTDEELERLMEFLNKNKDFIKNIKK